MNDFVYNIITIFIAHLFSDSDGHNIVEQRSLDKTLDVSVDKDLNRVPDDRPEEQAEEDQQAAPPQRPLPGLVAENILCWKYISCSC